MRGMVQPQYIGVSYVYWKITNNVKEGGGVYRGDPSDRIHV